MRGGPSAPLERTVRPSQRATHQKQNHLWSFSQLTGGPSSPQGRTVRGGPPFTLKSHQRPNTSRVKLLSDLRTVRAPGPDRPQSNHSAQARETTSPDEFYKTPADCPRPRSRPSAVRPSSPNRAATSLDKKNYTGGPSAEQVRTVRRSFLFPQVDQQQLQHLLLCKCANTTT